ncbi:MAG: uracil-DNA glycosylase [Candidatus Nanoarchaeia archaeon]|nr:uracil-DNA glycosylase [Candidatus Haiyanarchaeum thermophilum]MCW1306923.1 uracil-DNA glycosylase [Candidatus Haiyanarchaeum thermophilum]MCW1308340.1 uracil-DNA glycosylase [Candidatus Haiyanarchaeum thermophilum]MCW1309050.1 uracil-DNA glycosylase [Candidatus Haiyanarchaeum thermophilum]
MWEELAERIRKCRACSLSTSRKHVVIGEGGFRQKILLIGEAPGFYEDLQGRPFVGNAGKILDEMLSMVGWSREDVFITNVVKCRPPGNRRPRLEEIQKCGKFLEEQISLLGPRTIITLGDVATSFIFKKFGIRGGRISEVHGKQFKINNISIVPMFHPAAALHDPRKRKEMIEDWRKIKQILSD